MDQSMSNPVTNADIEDVLSSIRRLVSEDVRPQVAPPVAQGMGRLVLTPALRVMENHGFQDDDGDAEPQTDHAGDDIFQSADDLPRPEWVDAEELRGVELDDTGRRNLEARIAELEAVISDTGGAWEQDGEEGSANAGGALESLPWDGSLAEPEQMIEEAPFQEVEDYTVSATITQFSVPDEFAAAQAPGEISEVLEVEQDFEPDDYETDALTDDTPEFVAYDDNRATEEASEEVAVTQDVVLDEDMLRALVAEIVREELQGKLGERITRNVRKLVRREILRALASQDME